ncbi:MAG: DUF2970 domain-containing protein [Rhodocyclaceae bacterium]|nr:DUF2970 domain-containing protein [Rhodocyclaceae bacterium]MBX3671062.1 DUF2970 domain-containing protein [Rhodocyclaceae bacterium]
MSTQPPPRRASFFDTLRAVLGAFVGIRKRTSGDADMGSLNPVHVIIIGVVAAVIFVLTIVFAVRMIVSSV